MKHFLVIALLIFSTATHAQKYTGFELTSTLKTDGTYEAVIKPHIIDGYAPKDTKLSGLYGVLICYTVDGQEQVLKQDITYDIVKNGVKFQRLNYKKGQKVIIYYWTHFYLPEDKGPSKESCGNHTKYH